MGNSMTTYRIVQDGHVFRVEVRNLATGAGVIWTPVARFGKRENAVRFVEEQNGILFTSASNAATLTLSTMP